MFDLDGTLAETAPDLMAALNFVLAGEGVATLPVEAARRLLGAGGRVLIQRGFALAGRTLDAPTLERLFAAFLAHYNAHIADHTFLYPGVVAFLDRCLAVGWRLAVCTNKLEHSSKMLLGKLGVLDRFAFVCGQDTFGVGKPDPRPLIETIRAAGGDLVHAVMVGELAHRHRDGAGRRRAGRVRRFRLHRRADRHARPRSRRFALRRTVRGDREPPRPRPIALTRPLARP